MEKSLKNSVEILKDKVRINLELIHQNELQIKEILKEPVSEIRSKKLEEKFKVNKRILAENNDCLKLQREINKYLEKYLYNFSKSVTENSNNTISEENDKAINRDDYMKLTIKGAIDFDNKHPYYHDEVFLSDLISYFISIEDYETCSKLANR